MCTAAGAGLEEARTFGEALRSVLDGRSSEFAVEYPCHSPTDFRWFVARATRFLAGPVGKVAVVVHEEVTERKLAEEAIAHQALHDPLTDLPNRRLLQDRLEHALSRAERDGSTVAVVYLDLEGLAEGIETPEQAALLKEMGCDLGQGYYFAHPLPSEKFAELPPKAILP